MDKQLKRIASSVRREMEHFAKEYDDAGSWRSLGGYCAITSYFLTIVARRLGYNVVFVEGVAFNSQNVKWFQSGKDKKHPKSDITQSDACDHCWVEFGDWVIDLTATQFNRTFKKVYVVNKNSQTYTDNYCSYARHNIAQQRLNGWGDEQNPYTYIKVLRKRANKLVNKLAA